MPFLVGHGLEQEQTGGSLDKVGVGGFEVVVREACKEPVAAQVVLVFQPHRELPRRGVDDEEGIVTFLLIRTRAVLSYDGRDRQKHQQRNGQSLHGVILSSAWPK